MGGLQRPCGNRVADIFSLEGEQHFRIAQDFCPRLLADGDVERCIRRPDIAARNPRIVDDDLAKLAGDDRPVVHVPRHRHRDFGGKARGEVQQPVSHRIHPGCGQRAGALDHHRVVNRLPDGRPGNQPGERGRIAAHIQNPASAKRRFVQARAGFVGGVEAEMGLDVLQLADLARGDDLQHAGDLRVAAVHEGFHEEAPLLRRDFRHRRHLGRVHPGGLFAEHMLAGAQSGNGQFGVPGVRGGDIDRVNVGIGHQRRVGVIALGRRNCVFVAETGALGRVAAGDGGQLARCRLRQTVGIIVGNGTRADDAPAYGHGVLPCFRRDSSHGAGEGRYFY